MATYTNLFTPETWASFIARGKTISGFRESQRRSAERLAPGDIFVCYTVRLSRWCGLLRVTSPMFVDDKPIFSDPDPYVMRFQVEPMVALDLERAIPIYDDAIWPKLSLTKNLERRAFGWAQLANLRSSLRLLSDEDALLLIGLLKQQGVAQQDYPFTQQDRQRLTVRKAIRTADRTVVVEVPEEPLADTDEPPGAPTTEGPRESHKIQAMLARIGIEMGFRIWIPRADRQKILEQIPESQHAQFLEILPLNYDDTTLKTVEQIDVIWLKGRSMARAFEVEHTTAIYSGLLRMADLLALQPNMDIRLHIVAPAEKQDKVLREIRRPVFSLLDRGPLYDSCSYLPYEAIEEISGMEHLVHMNHSIIDEYAEFAVDD